VKYFTTVAGRDYEMDVASTGSALSIDLDGTRYTVDLAAVEEGGKYSVLVDRRSYAVTVDGDGKKLSLIISGHAFQAEVEDERERAAAGIAGAGGPSGGALESVMPGIVRQVFVAPGDPVNAGDRLLILEAMKMENEIKAEAAGVVDEVRVEEGNTVDAGTVLMTFAPPPAVE